MRFIALLIKREQRAKFNSSRRGLIPCNETDVRTTYCDLQFPLLCLISTRKQKRRFRSRATIVNYECKRQIRDNRSGLPQKLCNYVVVGFVLKIRGEVKYKSELFIQLSGGNTMVKRDHSIDRLDRFCCQ